MPETESVTGLKREVGKEFDQVLAEVTAELAAVPIGVDVPFPGLEPESSGGSGGSERVAQDVVEATGANPLQDQLELWGDSGSDGGEHQDDPITAFAPDPRIDWGPRRPRLPGRGEQPEGEEGS
jgi:hypothetical protein